MGPAPAMLAGARAYPVMLTCGALLALAFPEPGLAPLAWISLSPLLAAGRASEGRRGFALAFVFGAGFFGVLIVWISIIGWAAWALLVALQALFVACFGAIWVRCARGRMVAMRVILAAATWVALEYIRSRIPLEGFSWGQLAQSQTDLTWLLRIARFAGGWGVTFVVVAVNALIAETLASFLQRKGVRSLLPAVAAAILLALPLALPAPAMGGKRLGVSMIQGNVARATKDLTTRQEQILASHARLTRAVASKNPDLVVWPESSVELDLSTSPEPQLVMERAARAAGSYLIAGVNQDAGAGRYKVTAWALSPRGRVIERYQKTHLVPFGEYVPARGLLGGIPALRQVPSDAIPGTEPGLFELGDLDVATVISFEGDFGSLVREPISLGGRVLVVATNTSTWGESWASAQHLAFSRLRAAENSVWVAHAAISGISAFVAPDGRIVARTPLWQATTLTRDVRVATGVTPYARFGDWLPILAVVMAVAGALWPRRPRPVLRPQ